MLADDFGGGSRAGFLGLVRAMGRRGDYKVRAISTFAQRQVEHDGVEYVRLDQRHTLDTPDVVLAYYDTGPLVGHKAGLRIASHHTLIPYMGAWDWSDVNTAPCDWAVDHLRRCFDPHGRWATLPNAVEGLDGVEWKPVPGRVIYHTSPDRGLSRLLGMWPEIRARVPHATLHVVGDVRGACTFAGPERSVRGRRAAELAANLVKAEQAGGVVLLGRLTRADLLRELSEASCFAFPADVSAPCETWSISVHECLYIGVPVVLDPVDALGSLWGGHTAMPGDIGGAATFADGVALMLTDKDKAKWVSDCGREVRRKYSFDASAAMLNRIVVERP